MAKIPTSGSWDIISFKKDIYGHSPIWSCESTPRSIQNVKETTTYAYAMQKYDWEARVGTVGPIPV
jgi:hypothetical protein